MSFHPVSCPFCNAQVTVPERVPAGQRLDCPRCGENFVFRRDDADGLTPSQTNSSSTAITPYPSTLEPKPTASPIRCDYLVAVSCGLWIVGLVLAQALPGNSLPKQALVALGCGLGFLGATGAVWLWYFRRPRTNTATARFILANMAFMATAALSFALATIPFRREQDHKPEEPPAPPIVRRVAPGKLEALGYLPPKPNLVAGLHVAELNEDEVGREYLNRFRLGTNDFRLADLERASGLQREDIDHIVLSLDLWRMPPLFQFRMVVLTRSPYSAAKVRKALKAGEAVKVDTRVVYPFKLDKPSFSGAAWFAADTVLVISMTPSDVKLMPAQPVAEAEREPSPVLDLVRERMSAGTQVWVAGHSDNWERTAAALLLNLLKKEDRDLLTKVRTFGFWWQLDQGMALNGSLECADPAAATALDQYLTRRAADGLEPLLGVRRDADPIAQEMTKTLTVGRDGTWVNFGAKASAATVRKAFAP